MIIGTPTAEDVARAKLIKLDYACSQDPILFFNTLLKTYNPKVAPYHFQFKLFPFQEERIVKELIAAIENGYDIFFDKTREMGVTYTTLGVLLWYWKYQPAGNFLVGSRKQEIVDNVGAKTEGETSNKEESLFGKLDYMVDSLPDVCVPYGFQLRKHRTFMNLQNPENGNIISGESSNPNFSRGGRQRAIMLDEFAFWENDNAAWGSTADTTNCRIVVTTPGIRPNTKAKRLRNGTDGESIKVIELPYHLDPRKTPEWLAEQRERRSKEDFAREIMIDWEGSIVGVVYPEAHERTVGNFPLIPGEPLYVSWDFGLDGTAIQWWQFNKTNGKMRLIDAFKKVDAPIQWFFPFFGKPIDSTFPYNLDDRDAIARVANLPKAIHYGDPDVSKRSMTSRVLTSVKQELEAVGIHVQTNRNANDFYQRREATKVMLQKGIEVNDTPGTTGAEGWLESIDQARYPKRNDTSQATTAINLPIHDWTSHHRTSTEYFAVNFELPNKQSKAGIVYTAPPDAQGHPSFYITPQMTTIQQPPAPAPGVPNPGVPNYGSPSTPTVGVFNASNGQAGYGGIAAAIRRSEYDD
jgi:hypothetical protein